MCDNNLGAKLSSFFRRGKADESAPTAYDHLVATIAADTPLNTEQAALIKSFFKPRSYRKGQFYQRAGEVTKHGAFVAAGCFRIFVSDALGKESIVDFAPEGGWLGDLESARSGVPTMYHIEAIEPSEVLTIDLVSTDRMIEMLPDVARGYTRGLERARAAAEKRLAMQLNASAETRYQVFMATHPEMGRRVPQHMLASYLGMTPETLSRIRSRGKASVGATS